ncbi:MAG: class I SAM-dependent methyltransferase, partial [Candidatus Kariarchaeaceae archaeon]|jgi:demethylmenaquinone methyltransferase/2-methoxy-6-polyprenyl-1,4-benzoquinol methylase
MVKEDFNILSTSYDRINLFMSLGTDKQFRYLAIKHLIAAREDHGDLNTWIDIGTGTGHLANELFLQKPDVYIVAMDITQGMLGFCKDRNAHVEGSMDLVLGDASRLPFRERAFDGGFSGFVGRHFTDYSKTLKEHHRIIRPLGRYSMLEMGRKATPLAPLIDVYVGQMMSMLGRLAAFIVTRGSAPFRLLEETYARFHSPKQLSKLFDGAGFKSWYKTGLMGSIVIMLGIRKPDTHKR